MITFIVVAVLVVAAFGGGILFEKKNSAKVDPVVNQIKTKTGL